MRRRGWGAAVLAVAALSGTLVVQGAARGKTATVDLTDDDQVPRRDLGDDVDALRQAPVKLVVVGTSKRPAITADAPGWLQ